jgi:CDP-diacylglycerol--serine O-phosphatidyltransferase
MTIEPENHQENNRPRGRGIYLLPNLFTLTALFSGFYAIISAIKGVFDNAAIATFIAMIMDTLDGRVARLTNTQTLFGAELDSLSDMVSFGIAPALLAYTWGLGSLGKAGWLVAFVYTVAVALRLARFNTQLGVSDKRFFRGLPCPAGAAVVVSAIWCIYEYDLSSHFTQILIAILTTMTSLLMVSNFPYYSFKDLDLKNKVPFLAILLIVLFFVLISTDPPLILFLTSLVFATSGVVLWVWKWQRRHSKRKG